MARNFQFHLLKFGVTALVKLCPIGSFALALTLLGLITGFSLYTSSLPNYENLDEVNEALKTLLGESQALNHSIVDAYLESEEVDTPLEEMLDRSSKLKQKISALEEEKTEKVIHNSSVDNCKGWVRISYYGALGLVGIGCIVHAFWRP